MLTPDCIESDPCNLQDGNTPLHIATSKGDAGVVRIILCHIQQHKGLADVINIQNNVS